MREHIRLFVAIGWFLWGMSGLFAQKYLPVLTWEGPTPAVQQTKPGFLEEASDPAYSTHFRRVKDSYDRGYYSLRPVFNDNSSKYLLNSGQIYDVKSNELHGTLYSLSGNQPFKNPTWSKVDPDLIYGTIHLKFVSLDIETSTVTVIRDLGTEDDFVSPFNGHLYMDNKQSISNDDQYIVITDVTRGGKRIAVIDIQNGSIHALMEDAFAHTDQFTVRQDDGDPNARMNIGISPFGNYVVLGGEYDEHLLDDQLNYIRKLSRHGHADFGIDADGNEVYVSICPAKYEVLNSGQVYDLLDETYACGHLNASANYKQPGWAYLSVNKDDNDVGKNGNTQGYEIIAVKMESDEGTRVRKIIHPHNTGQSNETSSYGVPSPDGTLLMFNSAWDDFSDGAEVNPYIAFLSTADSANLSMEVVGKGMVSRVDEAYYTGYIESISATDTALGYSFSNWGGDLNTMDNPVSLVMDTDKHIVANFSEVPVYNLSTGVKGEGRVSSKANDDYNEGSEVIIQAFPTFGYEFLYWEGDLTGSENPATVVLDSNIQITAVFSGATGIDDPERLKSNNAAIHSFPNPFHSTTHVEYIIEQPANVSFMVVNTKGQEIAILTDQYQSCGKYKIKWGGTDMSGNQIPGGVYLLKMVVDNNVYGVHKMIISR